MKTKQATKGAAKKATNDGMSSHEKKATGSLNHSKYGALNCIVVQGEIFTVPEKVPCQPNSGLEHSVSSY